MYITEMILLRSLHLKGIWGFGFCSCVLKSHQQCCDGRVRDWWYYHMSYEERGGDHANLYSAMQSRSHLHYLKGSITGDNAAGATPSWEHRHIYLNSAQLSRLCLSSRCLSWKGSSLTRGLLNGWIESSTMFPIVQLLLCEPWRTLPPST